MWPLPTLVLYLILHQPSAILSHFLQSLSDLFPALPCTWSCTNHTRFTTAPCALCALSCLPHQPPASHNNSHKNLFTLVTHPHPPVLPQPPSFAAFIRNSSCPLLLSTRFLPCHAPPLTPGPASASHAPPPTVFQRPCDTPLPCHTPTPSPPTPAGHLVLQQPPALQPPHTPRLFHPVPCPRAPRLIPGPASAFCAPPPTAAPPPSVTGGPTCSRSGYSRPAACMCCAAMQAVA